MLFVTPWFLLFSLCVFALAAVSYTQPSARRMLLLCASIIFYYHFAGGASLAILIVLAAFIYGAAIWSQDMRKRDKFLYFAIAVPALTLIYFRYTGFIGSLAVSAVGPSASGFASYAPTLVPIGISFFAFEFCHYLADVLKGKRAIVNPVDFSIFVFFYPRMAAGPIIRFEDLIPQIVEMRAPSQDDVVIGLRRLIFGFVKKTFVADPLAIFLSQRYSAGAILCGSDVFYLSLLLYFRIYMDFSSYSDMALGLARLWGLKIPENFNFPFLATSPASFWRRWHISLSTWIRDYVYIPLGGNRGSRLHVSAVVLVTMMICGLWHGASWHFALWGVFHGFLLIGYRILRFVTSAIQKSLSPLSPVIIRIGRALGKTFGWVFTQASVSLSWLLFFYSFDDVTHIVKAMSFPPFLPALF